ncbi:hypothetical protein RRG08_027443 [Elysia crispata]|uniref:DNA-directed DNA polymerase n=1 Tax=Elysia crispata TaxID=231223 RepID=A0AAE1E2B1_9GAST|nr:hypothetical protein RRG08_027443 [Elysia crispata]
MDKYIEQILAEMPDSTLHDVVRNILDEPIPEAVKRRLLKPLQPKKYRPTPPPRKAKARKRKAIQEEFDPIPSHKVLRSVEDYQNELQGLFEENKPEELTFRQTPWALGNFLRGWQMDVPQEHPQGADPRTFLESVEPQIRRKLEEELRALGEGLKFQLALKVELVKVNPDGSEEFMEPILRHKQEAVLQKSEIKAALEEAFPRLLETLEKWTQRGSGWAVVQVRTLWLDIARYQPLRGGSYIPLPPELKNKKAVVNVKNKDDHCLRWALRSALFQAADHTDRPTKYPTADGLDFTGVDAPTPISQIGKVERQNDLAINVFGWDKGVIVHHREEALLRALPPWVQARGSVGSSSVRVQGNRPDGCTGGEGKLTFQNHHKQLPAPYIIYADFEALTTKVEGPELDPTKNNTQRTQHHEACSNCYVVVRCDGKTEAPAEYRGPNSAEHFLRALQAEERGIQKTLANPQAMRMTSTDWKSHRTASRCHVCDGLLEGDSVRDHCHITGKYRGAAHNACNLKLRLSPKTTTIPVVFHNLRGYDSHLLMQAISKVEGRMSCIPNNTEKYISFSLGQLRFIDSAQFLQASLDKLVSANKPEAFHITARYEPDHQKRTLLMRKGVYPYEYMDSWERFEETQLPPKEDFYSKLTGANISDSDYTHAQRVWETFGCQTLGNYTDLYCRTDVLLLADVFENFRKTSQKQYGLDPANYYTSPGLTWDALLKKTGIELELLTDYDQHLFIEKGMRGGISMVSKRHARANNPAVEGYDPEKPNSHILYLDANNLYGWAMSQPLPTGGFRWVEDCDGLVGTIKDQPADGPEGFILEVDLEYPQELHDEHNAYPLAPERMVVQKKWMSEYQHGLLGAGVVSAEVEKLVPNLRDKNHYVLHYRNLQLYLGLRMKLKKVHRALRFEQSPWMEPYIRMNTELRKQATSAFEKDLYKLANNSVFGKTMENLRKANIFDDDLAAVEVHKSRLVLNRPVFVGMSILDLSKTLMYDFYYNQLLAQYGDRCQLLYTDTDSLLLEIQTEDVYRDMFAHAGLYDTSDYPREHPLHSVENKKVLGKMTDECAGRPIAEYIGLRPKMYSILESNGNNTKKAKGVRKYVVKKQIRHKQYWETFHHGMDVLRSERLHIYGQRLHKVLDLRSQDNKALARRAWSRCALAGTPGGTTQGQWRDAAHPRVRRFDRGSEHQPPKGASALEGQQDGREP